MRAGRLGHGDALAADELALGSDGQRGIVFRCAPDLEIVGVERDFILERQVALHVKTRGDDHAGRAAIPGLGFADDDAVAAAPVQALQVAAQVAQTAPEQADVLNAVQGEGRRAGLEADALIDPVAQVGDVRRFAALEVKVVAAGGLDIDPAHLLPVLPLAPAALQIIRGHAADPVKVARNGQAGAEQGGQGKAHRQQATLAARDVCSALRGWLEFHGGSWWMSREVSGV